MARVVMFGKLADCAGWRERSIDARTLASLTGRLAATQPALAEALDGKRIVVLVNNVVTRDDQPLGDKDEVAFLPPMSGG